MRGTCNQRLVAVQGRERGLPIFACNAREGPAARQWPAQPERQTVDMLVGDRRPNPSAARHGSPERGIDSFGFPLQMRERLGHTFWRAGRARGKEAQWRQGIEGGQRIAGALTTRFQDESSAPRLQGAIAHQDIPCIRDGGQGAWL